MIRVKALGRRKPTDDKHIRKYPVTAGTQPPKPVPVTIGVNWYDDFDTPKRDGKSGRFVIGADPKKLGSVRGGHSVCIPFDITMDAASWQVFYDQGREGACVGFAASRMMSHLNRKRFDARWLWNQAKLVDEWPDTKPGDDNGTSVRAAMDVLRSAGHVPIYRGKPTKPSPFEGIAINRWATKVEQILTALGNPRYREIGMVPILNSWGKSYPRVVWMPVETLQRLLNEDGEATLVTDR